MGPNCQRPRNLPHLMRRIRGRYGESERRSDKKERRGIGSAYLAICLCLPCFLYLPCIRAQSREARGRRGASAPFHLFESFLHPPLVEAMVQLADPVPWGRSTADTALQESLVADGILPPNTDPSRPVWIAPTSAEREPQPPSGYVVSLGFSVPTGRFIHALCHHYKVELHNFSPNAISQEAVFVAVCEVYLGVEAHWDLWKHLFRGGALHQARQARAEEGRPRRWPHAARAGEHEGFVHPQQDDVEQPQLEQSVVLFMQRQRVAPSVHRQDPDR